MADGHAPAAFAGAAATGGAQPVLKAATVGMSLGPTSGMRDHARLLTAELAAQGTPCSLHWLDRDPQRGLRAAHAEVRAWAGALRRELQDERPDAVVLHYASFAYAHRGVPLLLGPALTAARSAGSPVIAFVHELAYPWRRGARGDVWAASQRAALLPLVRASAAVVVTTDQRVEWLRRGGGCRGARWRSAPVFSNLPPPSPAGHTRCRCWSGCSATPTRGPRWRWCSTRWPSCAGAVSRSCSSCWARPGPAREIGELWRSGARERGVADALSFSGRLPAQELSDEIARCAALICAASPGPTSRKGTLAGSLASGRPVVALDGPLTWRELRERDAARVVAPTPPRWPAS